MTKTNAGSRNVGLSAGLEMLPAERPECPKGHGFMELSAPGTPEQAWCGVKYRCQNGCTSSVLFPSPALTAQLASSISNP